MEQKKLPYYEVEGSYQNIGEFFGSTFRTQIQEAIKRRQSKLANYNYFLEKSNECLKITRQYCPNLITETEAIAKAADVPLLDYFFINNREVYDPAKVSDQKDAVNADHCTIVVGFDHGNPIVGHNEDWSVDAINQLFILKVTMPHVSFIGLNYNIPILGVSASMNSFGLVQCVNDLHQSSSIGVPKNYIARAILEARSLDEAEEIISETPKASGFNHVLVQGNEVRNIEIAGDLIGIEKAKDRSYAHTNHYLTPELQEYEEFHTKSSEKRLERANELLKNSMNIKDVEKVLCDTADEKYPICRKDETIGAVVLSPADSKAYFCYGNPDKGEFVKYSL